MNTRVEPGALGGPDIDETGNGDITAITVGAALSQSTRDALAAKGVVAALAVTENAQTGWDGLTKTQEHEREIQELEDQEEKTLRAYQENLNKLYERRDEVEKQIQLERENAAHLSNGKLAYKGDDGDPNYYYEDGTRIDDPKLIKEAQDYDAGHNGTVTKLSAIKASKQQEIDLDHQITATTNEMNNFKKSSDAALRSGSDAGAVLSQGAAAAQSNAKAVDAMIADQRASDAAQAQIKLQATETVINKVGSNVAALAAETTNGSDDDFYDMANDTGSLPETQSAAASTTRNTTVAAQQFGATSDLSSKGPFTAASAPVSIAALPDITPENNGSAQRTPVTPSPTAAV